MRNRLFSSKRGSALLIVLGMLSFMVISAVSFAMFMRQSRVPSSYLRRAASSRYLLKAALASAISRLDGQFASELQIGNPNLGNDQNSGYCEGVYDDPYPGVGPSQVGDDEYHYRNGDYWDHRVFTPFGGVSPEETVSTLTLEGLAYLPPALINEARIWSRRTRTAMWRNLSYDFGRYAFCAIDVSDCFDLNRVCAGERRFSSPGERVNLSSLFPRNGGSLDTILRNCSKYWGQDANIPFTSLADFNLVAGNGEFSPFCGYIGTSGSGIYNTGDAESVSNALFITDTWFPPTNTTATVRRFNLAAGGQNQPFRSYSPTANFLETAKSPTDLCRVLLKNIGGVGLACLYDYLDRNDRPISFCVPTTETVPMVCGVGFAHNSRVTPKVGEDGPPVEGPEVSAPPVPGATPANPGDKFRWVAQKYSLQKLFNGNMFLSGLTAFPFKRTNAKMYKGSFTGEALVKVFMGPSTLKSRLDANSALWPANTSDWNDGVKDGVVTIKCPITDITYTSDIEKTTDAVKPFQAQITVPSVTMPVFWSVWQEYYTPDPDHPNIQNWTRCTGGEYVSLDGIKDDSTAMKPWDANGNIAAWWTGASANSAAPQNGVATVPQKCTPAADEYVPHVLVWVRVINGNGETVDIVPARVEDDGVWGGSAFNAQGMAGKFGDRTPILEFRGDDARKFKYDKQDIADKLNGQPEPFSTWGQLYAVDPRYNFAPENWFAMTGNGQVTPNEWLTAIGADVQTPANGVIGTDGRDRDIFMFTSDQEYLQSIGELAFLPFVQDVDGSGDFFENTYLNSCNFNGADMATRIVPSGGAIPSSDLQNNSKFASGTFMWRTYSPFDDDIYAMTDGGTPVEILSGVGDFRVNPFSPDSRVLMAALRDTPFDYYAASSNENAQVDRKVLANVRQPGQANAFAFCPDCNVAELDDDALEDIAAEMRARFSDWARRTTPDRFNWERAFDELVWVDANCNDGQKSLFGLDGIVDKPLHGVDRKYLYSFWRECFQNRQQLFLVFVRAEPLTVGGMGEGSLASAQLGARGVALVWRDPQPPTRGGTRPPRTNLTQAQRFTDLYDNYGPHRTRVLFYHQFD